MLEISQQLKKLACYSHSRLLLMEPGQMILLRQENWGKEGAEYISSFHCRICLNLSPQSSCSVRNFTLKEKTAFEVVKDLFGFKIDMELICQKNIPKVICHQCKNQMGMMLKFKHELLAVQDQIMNREIIAITPKLTQTQTSNKAKKALLTPTPSVACKNRDFGKSNQNDSLKCKKCGKKYSRRGNLVKHIRTHYGKMYFELEKQLKEHTRIINKAKGARKKLYTDPNFEEL